MSLPILLKASPLSRFRPSMLTPSTLRFRLVAALVLLATLSACDFEGSSLYDPDAERNSAPVVTDVSAPFSVVLAGIDVVTVNGQNFSATPEDNIVVFDDGQGNSASGTVLSASPTELEVQVPNLINPALRMRVAVIGSPEYSNAIDLPLSPAFTLVDSIVPNLGESPRALGNGADGSLYVTLYVNNSAAGIIRFGTDGSRSPYSTESVLWTGLAPAADGTLFGVRQNRGVYTIPEGSSSDVTVRSIPSGTLRDVAAVGDGTYWTGGTNTNVDARALYRFTADGTVTATVPFAEPVTSLTVADGALYVASATSDAGSVVDSKVRRFPFTPDGLGPGEVLLDVTAQFGAGVGANALAVGADGTVFVATNAADPLITISPSGEAALIYPGILPSPLVDLAWGTGQVLYLLQGLTPEEVESPTGGFLDLYRLQARIPGPFAGL